MRGARVALAHGKVKAGIIPADAGSTFNPARLPDTHDDHPRGCGEHICHMRSLSGQSGSSPRMRGALPGGAEDVFAVRIIPADAGSTYSVHLAPAILGDHPRGCGENVGVNGDGSSKLGSSPRMREHFSASASLSI